MHETSRIPRWQSGAGRRFLNGLAKGELAFRKALRSPPLEGWETDLIRNALRAPKGFASPSRTNAERSKKITSFARILDELRRRASRRPPLETHQPSFRGNREHLAIFARSVQVPIEDSEWNRWRRRHRSVAPDLRGIDLHGLRLHNLRLDSVDLRQANFFEAALGGCVLDEANLQGTKLMQTNLQGASLRGADLRKTWLQDSLLTDADLRGAKLQGANLIGCTLNRADLRGAFLTNVFLWGTSAWSVATDA